MEASAQVAVVGTIFQALSAWEISKIYFVSRGEATDLGIGAVIEADHRLYGCRSTAVRAALIRGIVSGNAVVVLFLGLLVQSISYSAPLAFPSSISGEVFTMLMTGLFVAYVAISSRLVKYLLRARIGRDLREAIKEQERYPHFNRDAYLQGVVREISELLNAQIDRAGVEALTKLKAPPETCLQ